MKIGIIGDTHRNVEYVTNVADWLVDKQRITTLYHLGDDYEDVVGLADRYIDVVQVPGIYHERYRDGSLTPKVYESVGDLRILLLHSLEKDLAEEDKTSADVILYGHTHRPEMNLANGHLYLNPGHLKGEKDKNVPASFAMLDIHGTKVFAAIYNLKFAIVQKVELARAESGLYKVS